MTGLGGGGKNESEPRLAEMSEAYVFFLKNLYIKILTCSHDGYSSGRQWLGRNVVPDWTCIHMSAVAMDRLMSVNLIFFIYQMSHCED